MMAQLKAFIISQRKALEKKQPKKSSAQAAQSSDHQTAQASAQLFSESEDTQDSQTQFHSPAPEPISQNMTAEELHGKIS